MLENDREVGTVSHYVCSNCRHGIDVDHAGHGGPMCPSCGVQEMTEMRRPECGECESTTFRLWDRANGRGPAAEPQIECVDCGWTGTVDGDGVWY